MNTQTISNVAILSMVLGLNEANINEVAMTLGCEATVILEADYSMMCELCQAAQDLRIEQLRYQLKEEQALTVPVYQCQCAMCIGEARN